MLAAKLTEKQHIEVVECPDPVPGPGQVLVRVHAVAICPSDVRIYNEGHAGGVVPEQPLTLGHEFSGVVEQVGERVTEVAPGDRVAVEPSWHCGTCDLCARGLFNICRDIVFPSFPPTDGAMAELIACPAHSVARLPASVSFTDGALLEPLGVSVHAVRLAESPTDQSAAVLGAGVIGLGILQTLLAYGVPHVCLAEPREARRRLATALGAVSAAPNARDLAEAGPGPAVVFEAAGEVEAIQEAMQLVAPGGRVVVVGIPKEEQFVLDAPTPRRKELALVFVRRSRNALPEALRLVGEGQVTFANYPTLVLPLPKADQALALAAQDMGEYVRIIVNPQER